MVGLSPSRLVDAQLLVADTWQRYDQPGRPGLIDLFDELAELTVRDRTSRGREEIGRQLAAVNPDLVSRHIPSPAAIDAGDGSLRYTLTVFVGRGSPPWDPTPALVLDVQDEIVERAGELRIRRRTLARVFERAF